ncbi:MAG: substrate-binding domain-containing protein [Bryobacteraceae bacterium]|nr:substrate-binding domain-containing protein [Bryobacteraceae bacterium]
MLSRRAVLSASLGAFAAGCAGQRRKRIAVIPKSTSSVFWVAVHEGADDAGREFQVDVLWNGAPAETDYTRQIQIVESMVAQRVDGIAIAAAQRQALVSSVERAIRAGIPVTVFDSGLDIEDYSSYIATDNLEAGRLAARTLAKLMGSRGSVGLVMHAPGSASTMDRETGFREVLQKDFPGISIVGEQFGMADSAKSRAAAENILTAHPELRGMFASSEPSSLGAALAVNSRSLADKLALVGFDSSEGLIDDLRSGSIDALVVQDPRKMGYEAVHSLVQKLSGQAPPKRLDLPAIVVARADLEKADVKKLLGIRS